MDENVDDNVTPSPEAPTKLELLSNEVQDPVDHELEHDHTMLESTVSDHPEDVDRAELQEEALRQLKGARNAEARVRVVATILDTYGADALLGLFFPEIGDIAVSATVLAYLVGEALIADVPATDVGKMAWFQLVDFLIGSVPVLGDIGDFFYHANNKSADLFTENRDRLVAEAIEAGVDPEQIQKLLTARESLESTAVKATKTSGKVFSFFKRNGGTDAAEEKLAA